MNNTIYNCNSKYRLNKYSILLNTNDITKLENIIIFEKKLRLIFIEYLSEIEIKLKAILTNSIYTKYHQYAHYNKELYKSEYFYNITKNKLIDFSKDKSIFSNYNNKIPADILIDNISFGTLSLFIKNINSNLLNENFISVYNINSNKFFTNNLRCMVELRNSCMHYNILIGKEFVIDPIIPKNIKLLFNTIDFKTTKIFSYIITLTIFLNDIDKQDFLNKIVNLFKTLDYTTIEKYGFPKNWKEILNI